LAIPLIFGILVYTLLILVLYYATQYKKFQ